MATVLNQSVPPGEFVFKQGDPATYFYCIVSGEVEIVRRADDGSQQVLNRLGPGEYFGEMSMLEGRETRSVGVRAAEHSPGAVEVLKLSRADFEAGFMFEHTQSASRAAIAAGEASGTRLGERTLRRATSFIPSAVHSEIASGVGRFTEEELRSKLLGFIRMVSRKQLTILERGEPVFEAGDPADRFYILAHGELAVDTRHVGAAEVLRRQDSMQAVIKEGEGFGEWALLRNLNRAHTIFCASPQCEVVSILGRDFLQLVEKSEVVRRSFRELKSSRAGSRPSLFVGDRPKPQKPKAKMEVPMHAYK